MVYSECNEHAREQPKRRDSIIIIYISVYAAYIGLYASKVILSTFLVISLGIVMVVFGALCSFIIVNFRSWSIQYVSCARAISILLLEGLSHESPKEITHKLKIKIKRPQDTLKWFFFRPENIIVITFIILSATPVIVALDSIPVMKISLKALIAVEIIVIYVILFCIYLIVQIKQADSGEIKTRKKGKTSISTVTPWIINFD